MADDSQPTNQADDAGQPQQEQQAPPQAYTQEDFNRVLKEREARWKAKYSDYDALKAQASKLQELERAQMDEKDRLAADMKALQEKVAAAERERDNALAQAHNRMIQAEVTAQAVTMGFRYPGDIYRLIDLTDLTVDEAGAVIGVKEALDALAKERPDYIAKLNKPKLDGQAGTQPDDKDLPRLTPEQERIAKALGIKPEQYAKRLAQQNKES